MDASTLAAAQNATIPDVVPPGLCPARARPPRPGCGQAPIPLRVLFCGINPGLYSGATGHHFARPGNRFWPALHASGFTPRRLKPAEQAELLTFGLGITNLVARATARADELTSTELREGAVMLEDKIARYRPHWLAVVGITAYRTAFGRPKATVGRQQEGIGNTNVWVLPNPSGLNAHWTPATLAEEFGRLHRVSYAQ